MNMKEIAQLAGVTAATVSNAINGTGNVSEKKRKEIMEIIEKGGITVPIGLPKVSGQKRATRLESW